MSAHALAPMADPSVHRARANTARKEARRLYEACADSAASYADACSDISIRVLNALKAGRPSIAGGHALDNPLATTQPLHTIGRLARLPRAAVLNNTHKGEVEQLSFLALAWNARFHQGGRVVRPMSLADGSLAIDTGDIFAAAVLVCGASTTKADVDEVYSVVRVGRAMMLPAVRYVGGVTPTEMDAMRIDLRAGLLCHLSDGLAGLRNMFKGGDVAPSFASKLLGTGTSIFLTFGRPRELPSKQHTSYRNPNANHGMLESVDGSQVF